MCFDNIFRKYSQNFVKIFTRKAPLGNGVRKLHGKFYWGSSIRKSSKIWETMVGMRKKKKQGILHLLYQRDCLHTNSTLINPGYQFYTLVLQFYSSILHCPQSYSYCLWRILKHVSNYGYIIINTVQMKTKINISQKCITKLYTNIIACFHSFSFWEIVLDYWLVIWIIAWIFPNKFPILLPACPDYFWFEN